MRVAHFLVAATQVALVASSVLGKGGSADFYPPTCAWCATHVVVLAGEEKTNGRFTVLESWKGDLKPGDRITIPEIAQMAPVGSRTIYACDWKDGYKPRTTKPTHVSFARIVACLRKTDLVVGPAPSKKEGRSRESERWSAASGYAPDDVRLSIAWIEDGTCYGFVEGNGGDFLLAPVTDWWSKKDDIHILKEEDLKKQMLDHFAPRKIFDEALATKDLDRRAKLLAELRASEVCAAKTAPSMYEELEKVVETRKDAEKREQPRYLYGTVEWPIGPDLVAVLSAQGEKAVPVYEDVLFCPGWALEVHFAAVVTALSRTGSVRAEPDIIRLLGEETAFWKKRAPTIESGWVDAPQHVVWPDKSLRYTARTLVAILRALRSIGTKDCADAVEQVRDLWKANAVLNDELGQVSELADEILSPLHK